MGSGDARLETIVKPGTADSQDGLPPEIVNVSGIFPSLFFLTLL